MAEEIRLVGSFTDNISPKLKKLNKEINNLTRAFGRMGERLDAIASKTGKFASSSKQVSSAMGKSTAAIKHQTRALKEYNDALAEAKRLHNGFRATAIPGTPSSRRTRSGALVSTATRPRGRGGSQAMPQRGVAPRPGVIGAGGVFGPMLRAGIALDLIRYSARSLVDTFKNIAQAGREAELGMIQMANIIQTTAGKSFEDAEVLSQKMRGLLAEIAVDLPGGTNDFIAIQTKIIDDMILHFGSIEAVMANLERGADSFVGLFGIFAKLANLDPALAARDIDQLRANPRNIKNIQILTRNANLLNAYFEELDKTPDDFMGALYRAMQRSMSGETLRRLENSFDVAMEKIFDALFNEEKGIFGTMRKIAVDFGRNGGTRMMSLMDALGETTANIAGIFIQIRDVVDQGALQGIIGVISELNFIVYRMRLQLAMFADGFDADQFMWAVNQAVSSIFEELTAWAADLDYQQFFHYVDNLVAAIFQGIGRGLMRAGQSEEGSNAIGTTVSGTVVGFLLLANIVPKVVSGFESLGAFLNNAKGTFDDIFGFLFKAPTGAVLKGQAPGGSGFAAGLKSFRAGLKSVSRGFLILGGVLETVFDLLEGKSLKTAIASGLGSMGGSVLGAAIGTMIAPGIGTAIGAFLGGYIGGSDLFEPLMEGVLDGLIDTFTQLWNTTTALFEVFGSLLSVVDAVLGGMNDLVKSVTGVTGDVDLLGLAFDRVLMPLRLLEIAFLYLAEWIYRMTGKGEKADEIKLQRETRQTIQDMTTKGYAGITPQEQIANKQARIKELQALIAGGATGRGAAALQNRRRSELERLQNEVKIIQEAIGGAPNQPKTVVPKTGGGTGAGPAPYVPAAVIPPETLSKLTTATEMTKTYSASIPAIKTGMVTANAALKEELLVRVANPEEMRPKQPLALTVNNTFNGTEMSRDEMAEAVSESIIRAMDDAGYNEVFTT